MPLDQGPLGLPIAAMPAPELLPQRVALAKHPSTRRPRGSLREPSLCRASWRASPARGGGAWTRGCSPRSCRSGTTDQARTRPTWAPGNRSTRLGPSAASGAVDLFADDVGMPGMLPRLTEHRADRPPEAVLLPVALHGCVTVAKSLDDLVADRPGRLVSGPELPQRDRGIHLHRPDPAGLRSSADDLLEPHRLDERQVLDQPGQIGARVHGATPGVLFAQTVELLEGACSRLIELTQEVFDLWSHATNRSSDQRSLLACNTVQPERRDVT